MPVHLLRHALSSSPRLFSFPTLPRALSTSIQRKEWSCTLHTGAKIPAFGLGTWLSKPGEVGAAVVAALKEGYRHVDCAHSYGNEPEIGVALQKCFKEGVVKREDVFITSKLWVADFPREDVVPACQLTLKNLQLDYLDLYLVHWPVSIRKGVTPATRTPADNLGYSAESFAACWQGMEDTVEKRLTKAIGISNVSITKTEKLLETAKIVPAVNQVECHPYFQQQKLKEYCDSKGILLEAYSPLGNLGNIYRKDGAPNILKDPVISEVAKKHKTTVAQVCIAFALHRGVVVIPKTVNPARITENLKSTELKLDQEDMRRLRGLETKNHRYLLGDFFMRPEWSPYQEYIWDTTADEKYEVKEPGGQEAVL